MTELTLETFGRQTCGARRFLIFGAGIIAYNLYAALKTAGGLCIQAFVVSKKEGNPARVENVPVLSLAELAFPPADCVFLIAVPEIYHREIRKELERTPYRASACLFADSDVEYEIMCGYFRKVSGFPVLSDTLAHAEPAASLPDIGFYQAKSIYDRPLKTRYGFPSWVIPIQAGAALTKTRVAAVRDDTGENLSQKNRNYSELTATYWVWKNTHHAYKGICHYRRLLVFTPDQMKKLPASGIDVILPFPYLCPRHTEDQFGRYLSRKDFDCMMAALKEKAAASYAAAQAVFAGRYLYNYNMLLARAPVFDAYCAWLFPILEEVERRNPPARCDRYLGYLGELLTSLYFTFHQGNLKIAHAEKKWLV